MSLDELRAQCLNCKKCGLCETRTNVVFGTGNPASKVLFIGEGPGENEDLKGEPFVGRGGMLLDKMLAVVDLSRDKNIYIANMVKCRPPKNRDPKPEEQEECIFWLRNQVKLIRPKIIVCLHIWHLYVLSSLNPFKFLTSLLELWRVSIEDIITLTKDQIKRENAWHQVKNEAP